MHRLCLVILLLLASLSACALPVTSTSTSPSPVPSVAPATISTATSEPTATPTAPPTAANTPTSEPTTTPTTVPTPTPDYTNPGNPPEKTSYIYPGWLPGDYFVYDAENHDVYTTTLHGTELVVAIHKDLDSVTRLGGEPVPPRDEFVKFIFDTFAYHWEVFQGYPYDQFFVKVLPQHSSQRFISATAIGFVFVTNPGVTNMQWFTTCNHPCPSAYKQFVTHEMFHAWNGETILCEPCHRDRIQPEYWFFEGATQYYGYRGTPHDMALYQTRIGDSWQRYQDWLGAKYDVPLVEMSEMAASTGEWQYDQNVREKGACLFYLMDQELMSIGTSLDDLMRYMYENYGLTGKRYTTDDVLVALNTITNQDWADFFNKYIYGTEPLPLDGVFEYLEH
jgi:hypothetical protein